MSAMLRADGLLSWVTAAHLQVVTEEYGSVISIEVIKDQGLSTGRGYEEMGRAEEIEQRSSR